MELIFDNQVKKTKLFDLNAIGIFLFCVYVFSSYLCNDILLPSKYCSYMIYIFLGFTVLRVITKKKIVFNYFLRWMTVFMIYSYMTINTSAEKNIFTGAYYFLIINFIFVFCLSQYDVTMETIKKIAWTYVLSSTVMIVLLYVTGNMNEMSESNRFGTEMGINANALASMIKYSVILAFWGYLNGNNSAFKKCLLVLSALVCYYGLFMTAGRAALLQTLIFIFILYSLNVDLKGKKHIIEYSFFGLALVIIVCILIFKIPQLYNSVGIRFEYLFSFLKGDMRNAGRSINLRVGMIQSALANWIHSPLWGHGFDSFKYYNTRFMGLYTYSHCNYTEILFNMGIIGTVIYYWMYWKLYTISKRIKERAVLPRNFVLAIVISTIVCEIALVTYTSTVFMIWLFFSYKMIEPVFEEEKRMRYIKRHGKLHDDTINEGAI